MYQPEVSEVSGNLAEGASARKILPKLHSKLTDDESSDESCSNDDKSSDECCSDEEGPSFENPYLSDMMQSLEQRQNVRRSKTELAMKKQSGKLRQEGLQKKPGKELFSLEDKDDFEFHLRERFLGRIAEAESSDEDEDNTHDEPQSAKCPRDVIELMDACADFDDFDTLKSQLPIFPSDGLGDKYRRNRKKGTSHLEATIFRKPALVNRRDSHNAGDSNDKDQALKLFKFQLLPPIPAMDRKKAQGTTLSTISENEDILEGNMEDERPDTPYPTSGILSKLQFRGESSKNKGVISNISKEEQRNRKEINVPDDIPKRNFEKVRVHNEFRKPIERVNIFEKAEEGKLDKKDSISSNEKHKNKIMSDASNQTQEEKISSITSNATETKPSNCEFLGTKESGNNTSFKSESLVSKINTTKGTDNATRAEVTAPSDNVTKVWKKHAKTPSCVGLYEMESRRIGMMTSFKRELKSSDSASTLKPTQCTVDKTSPSYRMTIANLLVKKVHDQKRMGTTENKSVICS